MKYLAHTNGIPEIRSGEVHKPATVGNFQRLKAKAAAGRPVVLAAYYFPTEDGLDLCVELPGSTPLSDGAVVRLEDFWLADDARALVRLAGGPGIISVAAAGKLLKECGTFAKLGPLVGAVSALQELSPQQKEKVSDALTLLDKRRTVAFLTRHGMKYWLAWELTYMFGEFDLVDTLKRDPYCIAGMPNVALDVLDNIAANYGWGLGHPKRPLAAVMCSVAEEIEGKGHTYIPIAALARIVADTLGCAHKVADRYIRLAVAVSGQPNGFSGADLHLWQSFSPLDSAGFTMPQTKVTYKTLFWAETELATKKTPPHHQTQFNIVPKMASGPVPWFSARALAAVSDVAVAIGADFTQTAAIRNAFQRPFSLVCGGPGTGKTDKVIRGIVDVSAKIGLKAVVLAPTAKAAQNIVRRGAAASALTVHRFLGIGYDSRARLKRALESAAGVDVIIVDESSMLDTYIFHHLVDAAYKSGTSLVMVGDPHQLPPVGPGCPFEELAAAVGIQSITNNGVALASYMGQLKLSPQQLVPYVALTTIYRTGPGSGVASLGADALAHRVHDLESAYPGVNVVSFPGVSGVGDPALLNAVKNEVAQMVRKYSIDVLTVTSTNVDVFSLNRQLRPLFFGGANPMWPFAVGDKVTQRVNNYHAPLSGGGEMAIVNGEDGIVVATHPNIYGDLDVVEVDFGGARPVRYDRMGAEAQLTLGYARTVHKAIGTEASAVVLAVTSRDWGARKLRLFYTAVTRAKKELVIVTDDVAALEAVINSGGSGFRRTRFGWAVAGKV